MILKQEKYPFLHVDVQMLLTGFMQQLEVSGMTTLITRGDNLERNRIS